MKKEYSVSKIKLLELCFKWWIISICLVSPYLLYLLATNDISKLLIDLLVSLLVFPLIYILFSTEYLIDEESNTLIYKNKFFKLNLNEMSIADILTMKLEWTWVIGVKGSVLNVIIRDFHTHLFINDALYDKKSLRSLMKELLHLNNKIVTNVYAAELVNKPSTLNNKNSLALRKKVRTISLVITVSTTIVFLVCLLLLYFSFSLK
ncbi:hypothetical protein KBD45_04360 [Candidatus Dojkabacteria bacterium]|nr:hypothetical protein [Candidatus Dojkabacteria bacterium]